MIPLLAGNPKNRDVEYFATFFLRNKLGGFLAKSDMVEKSLSV